MGIFEKLKNALFEEEYVEVEEVVVEEPVKVEEVVEEPIALAKPPKADLTPNDDFDF